MQLHMARLGTVCAVAATLIAGTGLQFDHPCDIEPSGTRGNDGFARGVLVGKEASHASPGG